MSVTGNGFTDKITLMVGVSEDLESITGIEILRQTDTPGLGAKIVEPEFKDKFKDLQAVHLFGYGISPLGVLVDLVQQQCFFGVPGHCDSNNCFFKTHD